MDNIKMLNNKEISVVSGGDAKDLIVGAVSVGVVGFVAIGLGSCFAMWCIAKGAEFLS